VLGLAAAIAVTELGRRFTTRASYPLDDEDQRD